MLDELLKLDGVISIEYDKMFRRVELVFDLRKKEEVRHGIINLLGIPEPRLDVDMLFDEWECGDEKDSVIYNLRCRYEFHLPE